MFPTTRGRAQSSTTGAILLVAVFLLVTTTLGTALLDGTVSDPDPMASAEFDSEGTDLRITHLGGDALPNDELAVVVRANGNVTRFPFASPSGAFGFGDNRTFSDALVANASNDVRLYHEPSGTKIERATLTPRPDPTPETGSIEGAVVGPDAASRVASGAS
ncbi:type IV pilin, partial [Halorubrum sp. AJ67]|uniref:type IV pilin n=1 Tax=Halorubrum sp. AJ67 TaxID=1173487 RepID=UPI00064F9293